jgi:hypothetical protein
MAMPKLAAETGSPGGATVAGRGVKNAAEMRISRPALLRP